jgi:hypothetical protein
MQETSNGWNDIIVAEHPMNEPCNGEYNVKYECAEAVAKLYATYLCDLLLGRRQYPHAETWIAERSKSYIATGINKSYHHVDVYL